MVYIYHFHLSCPVVVMSIAFINMKLYFLHPSIMFCEFKTSHTDKCLILFKPDRRDYDSVLENALFFFITVKLIYIFAGY